MSKLLFFRFSIFVKTSSPVALSAKVQGMGNAKLQRQRDPASGLVAGLVVFLLNLRITDEIVC